MTPPPAELTTENIGNYEIKRKLTSLGWLTAIAGLGVLIGLSFTTAGSLTAWDVPAALAPAAMLFAIAERAGRAGRSRAGLSLFEMLLAMAMTSVLMVAVLSAYPNARNAPENAPDAAEAIDQLRADARRSMETGTPTAPEARAQAPAVPQEPAPQAPSHGQVDLLPDAALMINIAVGALIGLALLGAAAWSVRQLRRRKAVNQLTRMKHADVRLRHEALAALRADDAYGKPIRHLLDLAHAIEQSDRKQRAFLDRYLGELDAMVGEIAEFRKHPDSPVASQGLDAFQRALANTHALLADRRDQMLQQRALTMETTAGVLASLIPGRRRQKHLNG